MIYHTDENREYETDERCAITEILNDPGTPDISFARARVRSGVTTELHALSGDEFYYILQGHGMMELAGRASFPVEKGDLVHIPKNHGQRITNTAQDDLLILCVCTPRFKPENYRTLE